MDTNEGFEKFEGFEKCIKIKYQYMVWHIINCGGDEIVNNLEYIQHVQTEEHQKLYKGKTRRKILSIIQLRIRVWKTRREKKTSR